MQPTLAKIMIDVQIHTNDIVRSTYSFVRKLYGANIVTYNTPIHQNYNESKKPKVLILQSFYDFESETIRYTDSVSTEYQRG